MKATTLPLEGERGGGLFLELQIIRIMNHSVVELGKLGLVPTLGGTYEIAGDALQAVEVGAVAMRAFVDMVGRFVAAVHTADTSVVDAAVANVHGVHHVHDVHHGFGVMRCVAVDLNVEDVTAACEDMVRSFDFRLVTSRAFVIDGHMVGVCIVLAVGDAGNLAELLLVAAREASAEAFGWSCQDAVVVLITLAEIVDTVAHVSHNLQSELLRLSALAMVLAGECHQALGQSYEADAEGSLVDDALDGVVGIELLAAYPEAVHEQGELLGEGRLLELEALVQLTCGELKQVVQFGEESCYALLLVLDVHALYGELYDIDCREADVATTNACTGTEAVLEDTGAAAHGGNLVDVALGIVGAPVGILVVGSVEVQEVGEETTGRDLACELIEVVVGVCGQVAHAALLLPYLNGEDSCHARAYTFVGAVEYLADDASAFCTRVCAVVNRREDHLIAAAAVDGIHVVDERLHGLMYTAYGLVHGMLQYACLALKAVEVLDEVIVEGDLIEMAVVGAEEFLELLHLLDEGQADIRCKIEVEGGDSLSAVHLILGCLHAYAGEHAGRFDTLGGTALAVACHVTAFEHMVQGVLHACERLGRIVVLVVDVEVVLLHSLADIFSQQVVVDEGFRCLRRELHHHTRGRVRVHISILACDVVALDVDDLEKHLTCLGLAGDGTLVAVLDINLGNVLASTLHELEFHSVLNFLHRHLGLAAHGDAVGYLVDEMFVFTADTQGRVYLIDGRTGEIILSRKIGENFEASPIAVGNSVVIGSRGRKIFKLSIMQSPFSKSFENYNW